MASNNGTCELSNSSECKIKIESTQKKDQANGDQAEIPPSDYLAPEIRKEIEEVVESKGITDYTILIEPGSSVGDNFLGFIGKVTITGLDKNKENTTLNWIVKAAPHNELYRKFIKIEIVYEREVFMYQTIFPEIAKFQEERLVMEPFNSYPKFIFAHLKQYQESFGMENVKNNGYVMRNRQEPLNWHHVKLLMKTYAKFHAVSLAMKDQKPEEFAALQNKMYDVISIAQDKEDTLENYKPIMELAFKALNPETDQEAIKKFEIFLNNFLDIFKETVNITNKYSVMGHGDSWLNNMLWKYDDPSDQTKPTNVCLLDFQLARYGSPVCDLSYFLFTCTDKSLRDEHYDDAIRLYYYTLSANLAEMGSEPEKVFPLSALQDELKRFSIIGMYWSVMVLSVITRESDEIPDMKDDAMTVDQMNEHWEKGSKNQDVYNKRVRDVIMDMYERGYLDCLE